jgi:hypothetical protein
MLPRIEWFQQICTLIIRIDALTVFAQPPSVGGNLVAVSTKLHAAPTSMVRFGVVSEPKHAGTVFTALHQAKVGRRKQVGGGIRHGPKNRFGGIFSPDFFDGQRARLIPNESGITLGASQKSVKDRRISPPSSLSFLYQRADVLTQCSCRIQKRYSRSARTSFRDGKPRQLEPMDDILVALKKIHHFSIQSHPSIQKIQREMPRQKHWAGP